MRSVPIFYATLLPDSQQQQQQQQQLQFKQQQQQTRLAV
jgi:hypothetical protein